MVLTICTVFVHAGLLVEVLQAGLNLGIQPSNASLRSLLACCSELESRAGESPLGRAAGPGFHLDGLGYVDLEKVLQVCRSALQDQGAEGTELPFHGLPAELAAAAAAGGTWSPSASTDADSSGMTAREGSSSSMQAKQLAAQLLRTWAFRSTFSYVEGVRDQGASWALKRPAAAA